MTPNKVNLGCQIHRFDGWINQDIADHGQDWRCDANKLPTGDSTVDYLYAGHLIEHLYVDTVESYVREWHRVLKPGGVLAVICPDFHYVCLRYIQGEYGIDALYQQAFGQYYSNNPEPERHHMLFDDTKLRSVMGVVPWRGVNTINFDNPPDWLAPYFDSEDISRSWTQLGLTFIK